MIVDDFLARGLGHAITGRTPHIVKLPFPLGVSHHGGGWDFRIDDLGSRLCPQRDVRPDDGAFFVDGEWVQAPYDCIIFIGSAQERAVVVLWRLYPDKIENPAIREYWLVTLVVDFKDVLIAMPAHVAVDHKIVGLFGYDNAQIVEHAEQLTEALSGPCAAARFKEVLARQAPTWDMFSNRPVWQFDLMQIAAVGCCLLNTKNIRQIRHAVGPELQRARVKRGKPPLVEWHELVVTPVRRPARHVDAGLPTGEALPIHWVRGHFKTYTESRKLFGRFVGRYWWQPHLAGTDADRFVDKDYRIKMPRSPAPPAPADSTAPSAV